MPRRSGLHHALVPIRAGARSGLRSYGALNYFCIRMHRPGTQALDRLRCPTRLGKNLFFFTDGRIFMLFVGSNYLEASVTSSAKAIRGNCLLRVREVIEFLPSLVGQISRPSCARRETFS